MATVKRNEAWVKDKVKAILKKHKVAYFMPKAGPYGVRGVHDFVCCWEGRFLAIETKAGGGKRNPHQEMWDGVIKAAKGISLLIDENNYEKLDTLLSTKITPL